jgi:peptidoglycan/LPS O-acetylase OafA/YrhL
VGARTSAKQTLVGANFARALACLLIVAYHTSEYLAAQGTDVPAVFRRTLGIDLFFVMSGFTLMYGARPADNPLMFMARRLARIVPLYWVLTFAWVGAALLRPTWFPATDTSGDAILASLFFFPHYDLLGRTHPPLFVGWTLNYLVFLYVVFSLSLWLSPRMRVVFTFGGIVLTLVLARLAPGTGAVQEFFSNPVQLEFAAGLLIALVIQEPKVAAWVRTHQVWPLSLFGLAALAAGSSLGLEGATKVLVLGSAAAVAVFGLTGQDLHRQPMAPNVLSWLGQITFPIYLLHPFAILALGYAAMKLVPMPGLHVPLLLVAVPAVAIGLAFLSDRRFEKPINARLRHWIGTE